MTEPQVQTVDPAGIMAVLEPKRAKMKMALRVCAHCSLCADSCFLFHVNDKDPKFMPSHKVIHSLGRLYKKRGRVDRAELESMKEIVWRRCVLCTRCYCPLGVDIPEMIALARDALRSQGIAFHWDELTADR